MPVNIGPLPVKASGLSNAAGGIGSASKNVLSITNNSTGNYTVVFNNPTNTASYIVCCSPESAVTFDISVVVTAKSINGFSFKTKSAALGLTDCAIGFMVLE